MSAVPTEIWVMWFIVFGLSIGSIIAAVILNNKEREKGDKIKW